MEPTYKLNPDGQLVKMVGDFETTLGNRAEIEREKASLASQAESIAQRQETLSGYLALISGLENETGD
jgi:hypothetical protein